MIIHIEEKLGVWLRLAGIVLMVANFLVLQNAFVGLSATVFITLYYAILLKRSPLAHRLDFYSPWSMAALIWFAIVFLAWVCFYLWSTPVWLLWVIVILTFFTIEQYLYSSGTETKIEMNLQLLSKPGRLQLSFVAIYILELSILVAKSTTESLASPWFDMPTYFWIGFGLLTLNLILLFKKGLKSNLFFFILYTFLFFGAASLIYKLGFGYDPFIHEAGMENILVTGSLQPKPLYYIGMYMWLIIIHLTTTLPLETINHFAGPIAAAVLLPIAIYMGFVKNKEYPFPAWLSALILFLAPTSYFIMTTPQNLTSVFAIGIIFLSIKTEYLAARWLISIFTLIIHPLYGVPLILYNIYLTSKNKYLQYITTLGAAIVFPFLFLLNSISRGYTINWIPSFTWVNNLDWQYILDQRRAIMDFIHIYGSNKEIIFLILAALAALYLSKHKLLTKYSSQLLFTGLFMIGFGLMKTFITLDFVTASNNADFTQRIADLAMFFLLPLTMAAFYFFSVQLFHRKDQRFDQALLVGIFTTILICAFYFTYPLKNDYINTKLYNVTAADIETINFINQSADGNYIVLANQMVGAAAISELGFKYYYNEQFYYSIPTGGDNSLYSYFEGMVFDQPKRDYMLKAMDTAGVDQAYFVINDYWTNSTKIVEKAKISADKWYVVNGGKNFIFYYQR